MSATISEENPSKLSFFARVVAWNNVRGLLRRPYNHRKETSFIIEEMIEGNGVLTSEQARIDAEFWAGEIVDEDPKDVELLVDSYADMLVFITGAIRKLGYDPDLVGEEVLKAIESRTGTLIEGKFVKDLDAERYEPDYSGCKIAH